MLLRVGSSACRKNQGILDLLSPNRRILTQFYGYVCKDKRQKSIMLKSFQRCDSWLPIQVRSHEDTVFLKARHLTLSQCVSL